MVLVVAVGVAVPRPVVVVGVAGVVVAVGLVVPRTLDAEGGVGELPSMTVDRPMRGPLFAAG